MSLISSGMMKIGNAQKQKSITVTLLLIFQLAIPALQASILNSEEKNVNHTL